MGDARRRSLRAPRAFARRRRCSPPPCFWSPCSPAAAAASAPATTRSSATGSAAPRQPADADPDPQRRRHLHGARQPGRADGRREEGGRQPRHRHARRRHDLHPGPDDKLSLEFSGDMFKTGADRDAEPRRRDAVRRRGDRHRHRRHQARPRDVEGRRRQDLSAAGRGLADRAARQDGPLADQPVHRAAHAAERERRRLHLQAPRRRQGVLARRSPLRTAAASASDAAGRAPRSGRAGPISRAAGGRSRAGSLPR